MRHVGSEYPPRVGSLHWEYRFVTAPDIREAVDQLNGDARDGWEGVSFSKDTDGRMTVMERRSLTVELAEEEGVVTMVGTADEERLLPSRHAEHRRTD